MKRALKLLESGRLSDNEAHLLLMDWEGLWARPSQILPPEDALPNVHWSVWLILAGRGWGKTKTGAQCVIHWAKSVSRIAIVAQDAADARDVMVEGESGILESSPKDFRPLYEPSKRRLTWPNGAKGFLYSAEDPDSLRGPQHGAAWSDELCKWKYGQDTWDNLQFGLRLGDHPQQAVTTTPRPIKLLKEILLRDDCVVTKGSTYENLKNLSQNFRAAVVSRYEGTRLGRQELSAELLDDIPGAMWQRSLLDECRAKQPEGSDAIFYNGQAVELTEVVVAVDPPAKSGEDADECGIVVAGKDRHGRGYVLSDRSMRGTPNEWGAATVAAFDAFGANRVVIEVNQGGEMATHVLQSCAKSLRDEGKRDTDYLPTTMVHASRGKATRAEPVSALYEQKKVSHVGFFPLLEDQMCEFTADFDRQKAGYSPDRVDALVWAFTYLIVSSQPNQGLMDYYREQSERIQGKLDQARTDNEGAVIAMKPPVGVNMAYGITGAKYATGKDGLMRVSAADVKGLLTAGFQRVEGS